MSMDAVSDAKTFVQRAVLPPPPPAVLGEEKAPGEEAPFDAVKQQAAVVGSDVVSFVKELGPDQRKDIVNATLLAQLVASKKVPETKSLDDVKAWYKEYFNVLAHIGFAVQDSGFAEYTEGGTTFEAHEAIIDIAKAILAGTTALPLVIKTLESLKSMNKDSPWLTIFHRQSRSANTARFQVSLADGDATGSFLTLMAFGISAKATVTQVLFFRLKKNESTLHHQSGKMSINDGVLALVREDVAAKIGKFTKEFVAGLDL
jgi:hypothetical protein